jgi:RNA polymerase sigma factor (sigma-70 family)
MRPGDQIAYRSGGRVTQPSLESAGGPITHLLTRVAQGEARAGDALLPLVYEQLRELARHRMGGERASHTLQATALVHEAYLRLMSHPGGPVWTSRGHFFHAAAEAMRRLLIDHARARRSLKRGGVRGGAPGGADIDDCHHDGPRHRMAFSILELAAETEHDPAEILALDEAISRLDQEEPHLAAVVRLRFYAGLSVDETAEALGISARTVKRDWTFARAWLFRRLAC